MKRPFKPSLVRAPSCEPADHAPAPPRPPQVSAAAFEQAAGIFRAAGDVERLRLLEKLAHGESCVTELATALREGLSTVSQRLRLLRAEGLVKRRREGTHIYYALADQHVADLIANTLAHASEERHTATEDTEESES